MQINARKYTEVFRLAKESTNPEIVFRNPDWFVELCKSSGDIRRYGFEHWSLPCYYLVAWQRSAGPKVEGTCSQWQSYGWIWADLTGTWFECPSSRDISTF